MPERWAATAAYLLSAAAHAVLIGTALLAPPGPPRAGEAVAVEIEEAPPLPEPPPAPQTLRPPLRRAAAPPDAPRAPVPQAPPPPNQPHPPDGAARRAPVRIGVALSSTTSAPGVEAPVGNTLMGRMPERAAEPAEVVPFRAGRYAPPTQVTTLPEPVEVSVPPGEYPLEAARAGVEGEVMLKLLVDETGRVRQARLLRDPGHGLGPAAVRIAMRYFLFRPARLGGEPVATEIAFTVQFELP